METVVPADLTALSDEEIVALEEALVAEFDALHDAGSADVAVLTEIAEAVEQVRTEQTVRAEAAEQNAAALAALAERVRPAAEIDPEDDDDEVAPAVEAEVIEEAAPVAEPVLAAAPKPASARAVRRTAPAVAPKKAEPEVVITAAADIPGVAGGASIDTLALAKAMHAKARTLSNGSGYVPVASITLPIEHKMTADLAHNLDVLEQATNPAALTAAGWCAPSQNLYDLFSIDSGDGLIDLPTVQITRGGLNVPAFLGIGDADGALWTWTEDDQDTPESTKPCLYIPCPDFNDYRLVAEGLCITAGNLTDRAFPELTRRFVSLAVNAHLHRLSAAIINEISGTATGVTMSAINSSAAGSLLHAIDVQVADYRSQYRMSVNAILDVVLPHWALGLIRADLALRTASGLTNVSDAEVTAHFATRHVRAQFVADYQPLYGMGPATAFPSNIEFLIFPSGGYVRGSGGTIDLGVVRDSVLNATNDYTAAWTEELYLVAQVGPDAREVDVAIDVAGYTGCCPEPVPS